MDDDTQLSNLLKVLVNPAKIYDGKIQKRMNCRAKIRGKINGNTPVSGLLSQLTHLMLLLFLIRRRDDSYFERPKSACSPHTWRGFSDCGCSFVVHLYPHRSVRVLPDSPYTRRSQRLCVSKLEKDTQLFVLKVSGLLPVQGTRA